MPTLIVYIRNTLVSYLRHIFFYIIIRTCIRCFSTNPNWNWPFHHFHYKIQKNADTIFWLLTNDLFSTQFTNFGFRIIPYFPNKWIQNLVTVWFIFKCIHHQFIKKIVCIAYICISSTLERQAQTTHCHTHNFSGHPVTYSVLIGFELQNF